MKRIGFIKSTMPEEGRVAIVPKDLERITHPDLLYFEDGYAKHLGIRDDEYQEYGSHIIPLLGVSELEIICTPKRWRDDEKIFREGQTLWGWLYVAQTPWLAKALVKNNMTAIAFEKMYNDDGTYVFYENRDITGVAGILQALPYAGKPPELLKIAVLGRGNVAKGVFKVLDKLGVKYDIFHRNNIHEFYRSIGEYDIVVNCVRLNDPATNKIITGEEIAKMKPGCLLVDISTDGVEGSMPQSIHSPVYNYNHILIFNNDHIPTLWPKYASEGISWALAPFVNDLISKTPNKILEKAIVISNGEILVVPPKSF